MAAGKCLQQITYSHKSHSSPVSTTIPYKRVYVQVDVHVQCFYVPTSTNFQGIQLKRTWMAADKCLQQVMYKYNVQLSLVSTAIPYKRVHVQVHVHVQCFFVPTSTS